jgi:hypothetical protein
MGAVRIRAHLRRPAAARRGARLLGPQVRLQPGRARLGAPAGAIAGQAAVGKADFRPAAANSMARLAARSLVFTQVSIHGSYFPDIFLGLLVCGLGTGLAFVTATVAALAGVAEQEAGLASALSNTGAFADRHGARRRHRHDRCRVRSRTTWQRTKARTRSPR